MQFLILSCNTGEGHNSAAKALAETFLKQNIECEIKDALAFWSPERSNVISKGHSFVYKKLPKLFGAGYRFEENHPPKRGEESIMYKLCIEGCDELSRYLEQNSFNGIICTHVFSAMMITEIKRRRGLSVKSYFISTDYTCSPGVGETELDWYIIPHPRLIEEFINNGLPEEKLLPLGIPVKSVCYKKIETKLAKAKLRLPVDKKTVLLTCGSMGCGPIKELCERLPTLLGDDVMLVVICGTNRKLYKSLIKSAMPENTRIIGYTTRMPLYMDAADLILTKPGGLSTTEAAVKGLPMVFINAVPGCETRNITFFVNRKLADIGYTVDELCHITDSYIKNPQKRADMRSALTKEFSALKTENICDYIIKECV